VYDPGRLTEVINYYRNRTILNPKPLMITEFGVDAFGSLPFATVTNTPIVNESLQAQGLTAMWQIINANSDLVMGAAIMEFVDEWWKGDFPFTSDPNESCPNLRYDAHNYCGNIVGNNSILAEEWLGVFAQQNSTYFMSQYTHCIVPRQAYGAIRGWWSNSTDPLDNGPFCAVLGLNGAMFYFIVSFVYLVFIGVMVEVCFYCCNRKAPEKTKTIVDYIQKKKNEEVFAAYGKDVIHPKRISRLLSELVKGKLYKYTDDLDAFEVVHMRVKALIWDKISSTKEFVYCQVEREPHDEEDVEEEAEELSEDTSFQVHQIEELQDMEKKIFVKGVTEVYFKYMEAYRLWRIYVLGKKSKPGVELDLLPKCRKRLDDVILWNVVHQTAGTISHAPEKVCQVFYFVKKFLKLKKKDTVPPATERYVEMMSTKEIREDLDVHGQALVQSLLKIFKRYYDDAFSKHINYDDLNSDGASDVIKKVNWADLTGIDSLDEAFFMSIHREKWQEVLLLQCC
jgi:hypothetical protein